MRKCRPGYNGFLLKSEIAILLPARIHVVGAVKDASMSLSTANYSGHICPPVAIFESPLALNFLALGLTQKDHQVNLKL